MRRIMRGRVGWLLCAVGALVLVGGSGLVFVMTRPREAPTRAAEPASGPVRSAPPAADGEWTRPPAELYTVRGKLIAASASRWMIEIDDGADDRYSIKDATGRTVGRDFHAQSDACTRTRSGVLGCQIGATFAVIDLATGHRDVRAVEDTLRRPSRPVPLADGWVIGVNGARRVISEAGQVRWRLPADEQILGAERIGPSFDRGDLLVTTNARQIRQRVRNAATGAVIAECDCTVTLLADGFATQPATTVDGSTTLYTSDGRRVATYPPGVEVAAGGTRTVITEPLRDPADGRPQRRIRTADGRVFWEGDDTPADRPIVCGDWLIGPDRVISIIDGAVFAPSGLDAGIWNCLAAGPDWLVTSSQMILPRSGAWGPLVGALESCGPYSVRLDDDPSRAVVRRNDGAVVRIGPQPDPAHVVAAARSASVTPTTSSRSSATACGASLFCRCTPARTRSDCRTRPDSRRAGPSLSTPRPSRRTRRCGG